MLYLRPINKSFMDFKKIKAPTSTVTYNREDIENKTDNIYKAISIIAKRTVQINEDIKKEQLMMDKWLNSKIQSYNFFKSINYDLWKKIK